MNVLILKELSVSHRIVSYLTTVMGLKKSENLAQMEHTIILMVQQPVLIVLTVHQDITARILLA